MSCIAWNCRGLRNPRKVPVLKNEIISKGPKFVFLCETKLFVRELAGVARKLGFDFWVGVDCDSSGGVRSGGLGLFWNMDCPVNLYSYSHNHIDVCIGDVNSWRFTGIYGHPEDEFKWKTWSLLRRLATSHHLPWLCVGDFNEILTDTEKSGGNKGMIVCVTLDFVWMIVSLRIWGLLGTNSRGPTNKRVITIFKRGWIADWQMSLG